MYKNLFIDLDDTLWDTYHNNKECLEEVYSVYKFDRYYTSFEVFFDCYFSNNEKLWAEYRQGVIDKSTLILERFLHVLRPLGIEDVQYVLNLNNDFLQRTTNKTRLIPGAIDLLKYLKPKYRLFILSNGFREVQEQKLTNSGLAPFFSKMILSEDAGINKPHQRIFDFALVNTNSRRAESLMIGDSWDADIEGAYRSKIDQIWFNPGNLSPKGISPTYTISSLDEIKRIL